MEHAPYLHQRDLPPDFFKYGVFVYSPAVPFTKEERPVVTKLQIDKFIQLGFPKDYVERLTIGSTTAARKYPTTM